MKPLIIVAAFAAVLTSCSKPAQEDNSATDTTATANTSVAQPVKLAGEELERLKAEIFKNFHDREVYEGQQMIVTENFRYNDNGSINYKVVTYNRTHTEYDEIGEVIVEEGEEPGDPVNAYDTVVYEIKEVILNDISAPEAATKTYNVRFEGSRTWRNKLVLNQYGQTFIEPVVTNLEPIRVDFSGPAFRTEQLYLKAKIALWTDEDIKRIPKESLALFRNEIFARHGHTFKTPKMKKNFEGEEWYFEVFDDAGPYLNEFEKKNVEFIKTKEG